MAATDSGPDPAEQMEREAGLTGLQQPDDETDDEKQDLIETLSNSDDLAPATAEEALQNLLSTDIPQANFSNSQLWEHREWVRVALRVVECQRPHSNQDVTGDLRAYVHDDPDADLEPMSVEDRIQNETFQRGMDARVSKARQGGLVESALSSIKQSVVRRVNSGSSSGGLLGRLKGGD